MLHAVLACRLSPSNQEEDSMICGVQYSHEPARFCDRKKDHRGLHSGHIRMALLLDEYEVNWKDVNQVVQEVYELGKVPYFTPLDDIQHIVVSSEGIPEHVARAFVRSREEN